MGAGCHRVRAASSARSDGEYRIVNESCARNRARSQHVALSVRGGRVNTELPSVLGSLWFPCVVSDTCDLFLENDNKSG